MTTAQSRQQAQVGDGVEAPGLPGKPTRCGEIVEVLGTTGREHYRVRWDDQHESVLYPADGVRIVKRTEAGKRQ